MTPPSCRAGGGVWRTSDASQETSRRNDTDDLAIFDDRKGVILRLHGEVDQ
jgi:hypothetical protein